MPSPAGPSPYGISAAALPWNQGGFVGYDELAEMPQDSSLVTPRKYLLEASALTGGPPAGAPEVAVLIAHLPEHAVLVVDGRRTRSEGRTRYLQSPPLTPGEGYSYTVGVTWIEDGRWVSQTRKVPVRAGLTQAIYLRFAPTLLAKTKREAQIEANLAKLNPEDREVARQQSICIIRNEVRLGENGVPVKVMLKNHRVFVCEAGCVKQAQADPELNWAKAQALRARSSKALQEK
jgi:uncharacterized protein (TIGR03000 family)